jgi:hypothetical protein
MVKDRCWNHHDKDDPQETNPTQYHCGTCKNKDEWSTFPFKEPCPLADFNRLNPHDIIFITEKIGCASHPSLINAEQRIADVIEELDRRKVITRVKLRRGGLRIAAFDEAISLLREVKK